MKCQVSVERIVLDLDSEVMRGPGSIPTGNNILSLNLFHIVKPLMPILALLPISSNLWKTRMSRGFPSGFSTTIRRAWNHYDSDWDCPLRPRLVWLDVHAGNIKHGFVFVFCVLKRYWPICSFKCIESKRHLMNTQLRVGFPSIFTTAKCHYLSWRIAWCIFDMVAISFCVG